MEPKQFLKIINNKNYIKLKNKNYYFENKLKTQLTRNINKIINFIIFILYTIFIIFIACYISKKKKSLNKSNIELLKIITNNNRTLYEGAEKCLMKNTDEDLCLYQFLCPKEVKGKNRVLIGEKIDGSYVMLDDFENIKIAYSIGIRELIHFDKALEDRGIDVYMYDHTIDRLPYENMKFHWKKIGIGGNYERAYNIQTLQDMMKENGHLNEKNMILKMDIEGAEWNSLKDVSEETLTQFKYILLEYHFFKEDLPSFYNTLKKIYKTHQPFYMHCCPFLNTITFGNNRLCQAIEISYIIRTGYQFTTDKSVYPIPELSYGYKEGFNINIIKLFDI